VSREGATHVAVAFDHPIESFRNELFAGYKSSVGVPEELLAQFSLAEQACAALGLVYWPMDEFEADDALATAAQRLAADSRVERVLLCTPDKDLAQCVMGQRVVQHDRKGGVTADEEAIRMRYGVEPRSIPDWLALVGDTADGIPGLPRFGAKTSSLLLARWKKLEAIPDDPSEWAVPVRGAVGLADTLRKRRAEALLYRELATLRTDAPIDCELSSLRWGGALRPELLAICERLGERTLPQRITRWAD
jgi:5'-3' exonuclease